MFCVCGKGCRTSDSVRKKEKIAIEYILILAEAEGQSILHILN